MSLVIQDVENVVAASETQSNADDIFLIDNLFQFAKRGLLPEIMEQWRHRTIRVCTETTFIATLPFSQVKIRYDYVIDTDV